MTFAQIRYFVEVAECLNFTEAANRLYVSQQVVSKQIITLEKELDIKLLERTTKQVVLTQGGKILFETWKELLSKNDEAIKSAFEISKRQNEKVRIGVAEISYVIDFISLQLEDYIREFPGVELEYEVYSFGKLHAMLNKHEVDIIISVLSELESDMLNLNMRPLVDLFPGIILSDIHPLSKRTNLQVSDLANETFYIFSESYSRDAKEKILDECKVEGFVPKKIHYCDSIHSMELGLSTGKGVSISYSAFFRNEKNKLKFYPIVQKFGSGPPRIVAAWQDKETQRLKNLVDCLSR